MTIEMEFLIQYYQDKLRFYKQLNLDKCTKNELLQYGEEASNLLKIMKDYQAEGYYDIFEILSIRINPFEFLQTFIQNILKKLKETSEQAVFYLFSQFVEPNCLSDINFSNDIQELNVYLAKINQQVFDVPNVRQSFSDSQQMALWQSNVEVIMREQTAFLSWCVKKFNNNQM